MTLSFLTDTQERFLLAITARVPAERIAEVHVFQPIRQGGVESGVAVVAAWPETAALVPERDDASESDAATAAEGATEPVEGAAADPALEALDQESSSEFQHAPDDPPLRHVIYTARYRHVLKGPDRGKWEATVVAEADAPLVTVDAVVRGVQRRAGDVDDPIRMEGADVRHWEERRERDNAARA